MVKFGTRAGLSIIALFVAVLFVGSLAFAQPAAKPAQPGATTAQPAAQPQGQGVGPSKDWTDQQLQDLSRSPGPRKNSTKWDVHPDTS